LGLRVWSIGFGVLRIRVEGLGCEVSILRFRVHFRVWGDLRVWGVGFALVAAVDCNAAALIAEGEIHVFDPCGRV
jgi:hypothetical protein